MSRRTDAEYGRLNVAERALAVLAGYPGLTVREVAEILSEDLKCIRTNLHAFQTRHPHLLLCQRSGDRRQFGRWYLTALGFRHVEEVRRRIDAYHTAEESP